jgi:hypothetical protein
MEDSDAAANRGRGTDLILAHCRAFARLENMRPPAFARVEVAIGPELARLLVVGLAGRVREQGVAA